MNVKLVYLPYRRENETGRIEIRKKEVEKKKKKNFYVLGCAWELLILPLMIWWYDDRILVHIFLLNLELLLILILDSPFSEIKKERKEPFPLILRKLHMKFLSTFKSELLNFLIKVSEETRCSRVAETFFEIRLKRKQKRGRDCKKRLNLCFISIHYSR